MCYRKIGGGMFRIWYGTEQSLFRVFRSGLSQFQCSSGYPFLTVIVFSIVYHPGGGGGGGALRYRWGTHPRYVFRGRRGLFLRPPHVRDFVKEGYFFVPRYEVWGSKSHYNPRNVRGSDAEWLPKWLGFRVCCRHLLPLNTQGIIKSLVKIRVPVHPMSVFW